MASYHVDVKDAERVEYCAGCGSRLVAVLKEPTFDSETGTPISKYTYLCMNTRCSIGCYDNGGHLNGHPKHPNSTFGEILLLLSCNWSDVHQCYRCGYQSPHCR